MKYAIIENEYYAMRQLMSLMSSMFPDFTPVFTAESVEESVEYFSGRCDAALVFMDIELTDGQCFDILRQTEVPVPVIFTTAYDDHALRAFRMHAIDYLLKPVDSEALRHAVERFLACAVPPPSQYAGIVAPQHTRIRTIAGDTISYIDTGDVAWLEADDKYTFAIRRDGRRLLTAFTSLTRAGEILDTTRFFRVSRGILASVDSIDSIHKFFNGRLTVRLRAGERVVTERISAARREAFLAWLGAGQ